MSKPYPALCKDCRHAVPEVGNEWNLRCHHPTVNARDSWTLACGKGNGSACHAEREKGFFSACGMSGRLWVAKGHNAVLSGAGDFCPVGVDPLVIE